MITALGGSGSANAIATNSEALAKGVIDARWFRGEVVPSINSKKSFVTILNWIRGLGQFSNSVFIFGMNLAKYESLPPDLKKGH